MLEIKSRDIEIRDNKTEAEALQELADYMRTFPGFKLTALNFVIRPSVLQVTLEKKDD
jgi:hypothetical protein